MECWGDGNRAAASAGGRNVRKPRRGSYQGAWRWRPAAGYEDGSLCDGFPPRRPRPLVQDFAGEARCSTYAKVTAGGRLALALLCDAQGSGHAPRSCIFFFAGRLATSWTRRGGTGLPSKEGVHAWYTFASCREAPEVGVTARQFESDCSFSPRGPLWHGRRTARRPPPPHPPISVPAPWEGCSLAMR